MSIRMDNKVCMITGPTSGIGQGTAIELAKLGAKIVLVGRDTDKCERVKQDILRLGGLEPIVIQCDLSSLSEIERAANEFLALDSPLHVLMNNAGAINRSRSVTTDGLEETIAVSYFASFKLTQLLLDCLRKSGNARILNITSNSYFLGRLNFDDLNFEKKYGPLRAYSTSKLAMIQFSRKLAEHLKDADVTVNAVHPGVIYTNIGIGNNEGILKIIADFFWSRIAKPIEYAYKTTLYAATSEELNGVSGQYLTGEKVGNLFSIAKRDDVRDELWDMSQKITGVSFT